MDSIWPSRGNFEVRATSLMRVAPASEICLDPRSLTDYLGTNVGHIARIQGGARLHKHLAMSVIVTSVLIAGCAPSLAILMSTGSARPLAQFVMMPRDSDNVYHGIVNANGFVSRTITINVDGRIYAGPFAKTGSTMLASADNHRLRCDTLGVGVGHGAGICVDDFGRVYDAVLRE
jgi:hypothetical protein